MKFLGVEIKNILSFEDAKFSFQDYNIVVGTNNSGKTNLLRILEMISTNRFESLNLLQKYKFDKDKPSRLIIEFLVTNKEFKLILESIFRYEINVKEFPDSCRVIKIVINWNDIISENPIPNNIQIYLKHGISILYNHNEALIFDIEHLSPTNPQKFIDKVDELSFDKIKQIFYDTGINELTEIPMKVEWGDFFTRERKRKKPLDNNGKWFWKTGTIIQYNHHNPIKFVSEMMDELDIDRSSSTNIHFSNLLYSTIKKNFISIGEIYPEHSSLISNLFRLKSIDDDSYKFLQKTFTSLFNNITMKVEQDRKNETQKRIIIKEKNKEFTIEESASGHYAALHILHTILNQPDHVLVLDEPEIHFHPTKIRQLGQKFMELVKDSENQIIVITHSPKFVDFRLLDPGYPYQLSNIIKEDNGSIVSTLPSTANINLSPHLFNPEMFFGNFSFLVEGADDEFVIRAISDSFESIFDGCGITIINCWGVGNIFSNIQLHKYFHIPLVAMADKEYTDDETDVVKLPVDLEKELEKTGWSGTKNQLKPEIAYCHIIDLLKTTDGLQSLKTTKIWTSFSKILEKAGIDADSLSVQKLTE